MPLGTLGRMIRSIVPETVQGEDTFPTPINGLWKFDLTSTGDCAIVVLLSVIRRQHLSCSRHHAVELDRRATCC